MNQGSPKYRAFVIVIFFRFILIVNQPYSIAHLEKFGPLGKEIDWFDVSEKYFDFRFLI